ncbi:MAG: excinuclease ABC subunit C, partial [Zetaproteobacteria bacterium]
GTMWTLLSLIHRTFPLRTCRSIAGRTRCLEYHLGRCQAPCEGLVTPQEYGETVEKVRLLLEGKDREVIGQLARQMQQASDRLEFERAARLRDQIESLRRAGEGQRAISSRGEDHDVFGVAQDGREAQVQLLVVRGGKLIGRDRFGFDDVPPGGAGGLLGALLPQYYLGAREIPRTVLASHVPP